MQVSYGPPGRRGVTTLLAVGADELGAELPIEKAVRVGPWYMGAIAVVGALAGSRSVRDAGIGAAVALLLVRMTADRKSTVQVAAPAPSGWY